MKVVCCPRQLILNNNRNSFPRGVYYIPICHLRISHRFFYEFFREQKTHFAFFLSNLNMLTYMYVYYTFYIYVVNWICNFFLGLLLLLFAFVPFGSSLLWPSGNRARKGECTGGEGLPLGEVVGRGRGTHAAPDSKPCSQSSSRRVSSRTNIRKHIFTFSSLFFFSFFSLSLFLSQSISFYALYK